MGNFVITGVSTGIGYETTRQLLARGHRVFGSVRRPADAQKLQEKLGPAFVPLVFDVTDGAAIEEAARRVAEVVDEEGLAGLVNNAGIAVAGPLAWLPTAELERQLDVNLLGVHRVTRALLPLLGARRDAPHPPGKILFISSVSGLFASPFLGPYCISKHALEAMADTWRRELMIYGIRVVCIEPGSVQTPIWDKARQSVPACEGTDWEVFMRSAARQIARSEAIGLPVEKVAALIVRVLDKERPRARYLIASNAMTFRLLSLMPARWVDALLWHFWMKKKWRRKR